MDALEINPLHVSMYFVEDFEFLPGYSNSRSWIPTVYEKRAPNFSSLCAQVAQCIARKLFEFKPVAASNNNCESTLFQF